MLELARPEACPVGVSVGRAHAVIVGAGDGIVRKAKVILEGDIGPWGPLVEIVLRAPGGSVVRRGMAIMDSGARLSVVDAETAKAVGATAVRSQQAKGVCGVCTMHVYAIEIDIGGQRFSGAEMLGKPDLLTPAPLRGPSAPGFVALLGQDFLQLGVLHHDGPKSRFRFTTE